MKVTIDLDKGCMHGLRKMLSNEQSLVDRLALEGLLWNLAYKAGICDEDGNLIKEEL